MRLRLLIILVALVVAIGFLPYLFHLAAQPGMFTGNTMGTTVSWTEGPDVELDPASLRKLTSEAEMLVRQGMGGQIIAVRITSLGKRHVEISTIGSTTLPSDLQAKLVAYIQKRLPNLAKEQTRS